MSCTSTRLSFAQSQILLPSHPWAQASLLCNLRSICTPPQFLGADKTADCACRLATQCNLMQCTTWKVCCWQYIYLMHCNCNCSAPMQHKRWSRGASVACDQTWKGFLQILHNLPCLPGLLLWRWWLHWDIRTCIAFKWAPQPEFKIGQLKGAIDFKEVPREQLRQWRGR